MPGLLFSLLEKNIKTGDGSRKSQKWEICVVSVYDGDTVTCVLMLYGDMRKFRVRLAGIDCPEMKPPLTQPNRELEKIAAGAARTRLLELICLHPVVPKSSDDVLKENLHLVKLECGGFDKYGRLLATLYPKSSTVSVNQTLVEEGHARPYNGGTKEKFNKIMFIYTLYTSMSSSSSPRLVRNALTMLHKPW